MTERITEALVAAGYTVHDVSHIENGDVHIAQVSFPDPAGYTGCATLRAWVDRHDRVRWY